MTDNVATIVNDEEGDGAPLSDTPTGPKRTDGDEKSSPATSDSLDDEFVPHTKYPPIVKAEKPLYCPTCGFPPDFCEFGPSWDECQKKALSDPALRPYYRTYMKLNNIEAGAEPVTATNSANKDAAPKSTASAGAHKKAPVTVKVVSRARHKCATIVVGLDDYGIKLDKAAKAFKKHFACGSSVIKGIPGQTDSVEVQGDFGDTIGDVLYNLFPNELDNVQVHVKPAK